jgi:hypothetical protein
MRSLPPPLGPLAQARLRMLGRVLLGPAAVATLASIELRKYGAFTTAAGAYLTFAVTQISLDLWARWQRQLARRRLDLARERSRRARVRDRRENQ